MASGVWPLGFGLWGLASGVWTLGFGLWGLASGVWPLGFGLCLLRFHSRVRGSRCATLAPGSFRVALNHSKQIKFLYSVSLFKHGAPRKQPRATLAHRHHQHKNITPLVRPPFFQLRSFCRSCSSRKENAQTSFRSPLAIRLAVRPAPNFTPLVRPPPLHRPLSPSPPTLKYRPSPQSPDC